MKLFELRACWIEYYDCPDNGQTRICGTYETVAFAMGDDTMLKTIAADLTAGFRGTYWSEERANQLRKLYAGYDISRDAEFKVVDVTDLILAPKTQPGNRGTGNQVTR